MTRNPLFLLLNLLLLNLLPAAGTGDTPTYRRFKAQLDAVAAIDTHDHLWPFHLLPGWVQTDRGRGMNLASLWRSSYYPQVGPLSPWKSGGSFDEWWARARHDFDNVRATGFYRYQKVALQDLYGVDFDTITDRQARDLDETIFKNYADQKWLYHVITERANIELMLIDPHWARMEFTQYYPFGVPVFRVNGLFQGFHPSEFAHPSDNPYLTAEGRELKVASLDDYVILLDRLVAKAKASGAVTMKLTISGQPSLHFENVSKAAATAAFGRPRGTLKPEELRAFESFVMWRLCELSAKHDLPFQIHTGLSKLQGSNPILLVNVIEANPKTKFILFHGGYPWVAETGAIALQHRNVWIDSVWLPTISETTARRALHEWLEVVGSDRILWGADCNHAEGIYGAAEMTRRCLAAVLAEKVDRGDLREADALRIGRQVLRDNALKLFPTLEARLWKQRGVKLTPPAPGGPASP